MGQINNEYYSYVKKKFYQSTYNISCWLSQTQKLHLFKLVLPVLKVFNLFAFSFAKYYKDNFMDEEMKSDYICGHTYIFLEIHCIRVDN